MTFKSILRSGLVLSILIPAVAWAKLEKVGDGSASFLASGPAGLKIEGKTADLQVSEQNAIVRVVVPLANLDTGISLRNKHMREKYLEVGKFPNAELTVARSALAFPTADKPVQATAQGTLLIHGVSKPVTFSYNARREGDAFRVEGTVPINIKDYGVEVPSYLGVTVKPDVTLTVRYAVRDL